MASRKFFLIITDEGKPSRAEQIDTLDELKKRVKALFVERDKLTSRQVFVVYGERWHITSGPFPYLIPPNGPHTGQSIPLFNQPVPEKTDDDGFLGRVETELDPVYAKVTKKLALPTPSDTPQEGSVDSPFDS